MFVLQIQCNTVEEAERILAAFKHSADLSAVKQVAAQVNAPVGSGEINADVEEGFRLCAAAESKQAAAPKKQRGRPRREVAPPLTESAAPSSNGQGAGSSDGSGNAPSKSDETAPQTHTLDDAKAALRGMQQRSGTNDLAKPLALLGKFGAARISEVKPADYADFIAACNKA